MRYVLLCLFVLIFSALANSSYACSCAYGGYWVSDFVKDKVVFKGQVLKSEWVGDEHSDGRPRYTNSKTTLRLIKSYRNVPSGDLVLEHHSDGAACGFYYPMGFETLILANQRQNNALYTGSCTLNAVDEITLLNYFEKGEDVYIPSWDECTEEQIANPQDPKNCHYMSDEAQQRRADEMSDRRKEEWKARREARKAKVETDE